jgi:hypothetical protein
MEANYMFADIMKISAILFRRFCANLTGENETLDNLYALVQGDNGESMRFLSDNQWYLLNNTYLLCQETENFRGFK